MSRCGTDGVSEQHLLLFGTIVQGFAAHESLIQRVMAHILETQAASIMLLTRSLAFEEKRKALLDLLRHRQIPLDQYDRVNAYLNFPLAIARLRNDIIHSVWITAQSPDSIQPDWILKPLPRIKPVHTETDSVVAGFFEDEEEKLAYSLNDLTEIAVALQNNLANFSGYLAEVGLVGKF